MTNPFHRLFWSIYGRFAWDEVKHPGKARMVKSALKLLSPCAGGSLLDAGCGTGEYALAFARAGFHVSAVDFAEGMLIRARAKAAPGDDIRFQKADLNQRLPFDDAAFDCVLSMSVLQSVNDPAFTLGEMRRVLKPGGVCLFTHVPETRTPFWRIVQDRWNYLELKNPLIAALVVFKVWRERLRSRRYWTMEELIAMFLHARFQIQSVDEGPPLMVYAVK